MRVRSRRAFVLLAVLWITAGVTIMAAALSMLVQEDGAIAQNHLDLERARWKAEGCVERALAAADAALGASAAPDSTWITLDSAVAVSSLVSGCALRIEAEGARLDVNSLDETELQRMFVLLGYSPAHADSLASAIDDWRDPDDEPYSAGAERAWYVAQHRVSPRNGPFGSIKELHLVRGLEHDGRLDSLFDTERRRLLLGRARPVLLLTLDGMTAEAMAAITQMKAEGKRTVRLEEVASRLSPPSRAELMAYYSTLLQRTTPVPEQWKITAKMVEGQPPMSAAIELTVTLSGSRALVTRYLTLP